MANENTNKTTSESGAYIVCKGAMCKCSAGAVPTVPLDVTSHTNVYINDPQAMQKLVATVMDVNFSIPAMPFATCSLNPNKTAGQPCQYQPSGQWLMAGVNPGEHPEVGGNLVLTENAKLICPVFAGQIEFVTHGQTVAAGDEKPEMDENIMFSINSLLEDVEDTPAGKKTKIARISTIKCNGQNAKENAKLVLRKGEKVTFKAEKGNVNASTEVYAQELINWSVGVCEEGATLKTIKSGDDVTTYRRKGQELPLTFQKEGCYFIEGYGKEKKTGTYTYVNDSNSQYCVFLIEVRKDNEILDVSSPGMKESIANGEPVFEVITGTDYELKLKTLFPLTKDDHTCLKARVEDVEGNIVFADLNFSGTGVCAGFCLSNEAVYRLKIGFIGQEEKTFSFVGITNAVLGVETANGIYQVRPENEITFIAKTQNDKDLDKIRWILGSIAMEQSGKQFTYTFRGEGARTIKAVIPRIFGSDKVGKCEIKVANNHVVSLRTDKTTISAGSTLAVTAETFFSELINDSLKGFSETINWTIKPPGNAAVINKNRQISKTLTLTFKKAGKYEITANVNGEKNCNKLVIDVIKAEIQDWIFRDNQKQQRSQTGWKQDFEIYIRIPALAGREAKVNLWFDRMKKNETHRERFIPLIVNELKAVQKFNTDGEITVTVKEDSLWTELGKLKYNKEAHLFFTLSGIESEFANHRLAIYNSDFDKMGNHIFPEKADYTYLEVVATTTYSGRFTDNSGEQIERILLYGEDANAVFYVLPEKNQAVNEKKKYWFRLYENVKGNDILRMSKNEFSVDSGGSIKIPLNTKGDGIKENEHPAAAPFLPRLFYYCIYDKKEDAEKNKNAVFTYPKGYETGKDNDKYTKVDMKSDASDEDVEKELDEELDGFFAKDNRYNYYLQLKIAKETTLNKSIGQAAVKIGVPWERKEKKCKECVCKKYNFAWSKAINCEERKKVLQVCTNIWGEANKVEKAGELMSIMHLESDFNSKANNGVGYVGLIQFGSATAKVLGTTQEKLVQMTFIEQMDYVEKYLMKNKDKYKTMTDIYLQVLKPTAVGNGSNSDYIVFDESISVPDGDGSKTTKEQREKNINQEPWVTKYGYASNPSFLKEKNEYTTRSKWVYTRQKYEQRYGFIGGKTYIWEVEQELRQNHYNKGVLQKFFGACIYDNDSNSTDRAPWMKIAIEEGRKYKDCNRDNEPLKSQIPIYHKIGGGANHSNKVAWCASFASWCLLQANIVDKAQSALSQFFTNYKKIDLNKPIFGALIVLKNYKQSNGQACGHGHVSFLFGKTKDGKLIGLGGNQGRRIKLTYYKTSGTCVSFDCSEDCGKVDQKYYAVYVPKDYIIKESDYINENDIYDISTTEELDELNKKILNANITTNKNELNN